MPGPIRIKSSAEFDYLIKGIAQDIVDASVHFRFHQDLNEAIPEFVSELNQSPAFWNLTVSAQLDATLLRLFRVYDSHAASLSLTRLLLTIESNITIFDTPEFRERMKDSPFLESLSTEPRVPDPAELRANISLVSQMDPLVKRLLEWRHNVGAHKNPRETLSPNSVVTAPLTYEEIETLLERAVAILNKYSLLFGALAYSTSMIGADDYEYVLDCVRRDLAARDQEFDEAFIEP